MSAAIWILIVFAVIIVGGGALWMRSMLRKSRIQQGQIDYSKVRRWEDDDD